MDEELILSEDGKTVVGIKHKDISHITIPEGVTGIGENVFWGCTLLKSIVIPDSVSSIGEGAFFNCESLQGIYIP